jgi:hypothetical protein
VLEEGQHVDCPLPGNGGGGELLRGFSDLLDEGVSAVRLDVVAVDDVQDRLSCLAVWLSRQSSGT